MKFLLPMSCIGNDGKIKCVIAIVDNTMDENEVLTTTIWRKKKKNIGNSCKKSEEQKKKNFARTAISLKTNQKKKKRKTTGRPEKGGDRTNLKNK